MGTADWVVALGVADVYATPDSTSELVTQALLNVPVTIGASRGEWTHVTLPDYTGWMQSEALEEPVIRSFCRVGPTCSTPLYLMAVVTAPYTDLYGDLESEECVGRVYLSTALPLLDTTYSERVQVALPGERNAWLKRATVAVRQGEFLYPKLPIRHILEYARAFLGRPYLWGGTSWEGLDCSAFVQLCYRMGGYMLPRDARQQYAFLKQSVERESLSAGDLIFFGVERITHVAMALNDHEYIHAEGQNFHCVTINSLDPSDAHYYARLEQIVRGIKRI